MIPFDRSVAARPLLRRVLRPVGTFLAVVLTAIAGYAALGDVGVVEAAFWVVDPTSVDLHFRDHAGPEQATKGFAVLVTVGLVLSGVWIGETVLTTAFGGRIRDEVKRMQDRKTIETLEGHVVVCGYGMFGRTIAAQLSNNGHDVVVIETDETQANRADDDGHLVVLGDARHEGVLADAGIGRAATVVAAIDDSNANIQIAIVAEELSEALNIVVRVGDEMYESLARRAGADTVVIPEITSGQNVANFI
ncbi:NAD(P)-binding protein [Halorubrum sp. AD140]|uniref:potassium channel family protein n=1 Tax=Halorubrum sp. AD140 TaxID=3050073 RepID=UPI002ACC5F19|nr:NAD(P)-binding protein [Halorubrum sp. AD140]MDZ5812684.1 NAD(P)-binding protein [Halorubrum sp. AD140]